MRIFANRACLTDGWAKDVLMEIRDGKIADIQKDATPDANAIKADTVLPSLPNLHSHSFQRAMAGMTEFRALGRESFWTWRELMYKFLDNLTPEHIHAFASQTFMEMQKTGYASVGEFHYVHHQKGGTLYDEPAEHSLQIMLAAQETGIGLTHLPVLYTYGGAEGQALSGGQLRFGNSVDRFTSIVETCKKTAQNGNSDTRVGIAPHSLRATNSGDLSAVLKAHEGDRVHIHIAEQTKEIEEIKAVLGARPVEWLLDNQNVDSNWCLIHATHMTEAETTSMARSGAIAGLCPITESNLGDGIFNGTTYIGAGGAYGVGSDSNINISLCEELRTLEYSQRLRDRERNTMVVDEGSVGAALYTNAALGGAQALDRDAGRIAIGALADLVAIDSDDPTLCALTDEQLLDGLVFAAKDTVVTDLWSAGRHQVRSGRHIAEDEITSNYRRAIADLLKRSEA